MDGANGPLFEAVQETVEPMEGVYKCGTQSECPGCGTNCINAEFIFRSGVVEIQDTSVGDGANKDNPLFGVYTVRSSMQRNCFPQHIHERIA